MSDTSKSHELLSSDTIRDVLLWRRKRLSLLILTVTTVTWVLLDVYEFNFITVLSWLAMLLVTSLFLYANLVRLFRKEELKFSNWEVSEDTAKQIANSAKEMVEEGIRWMFNVSTEREWFIFARVVAVLWLLSYLGSSFDFLTFLYTGIVLGLTIPFIYIKNEERIKRFGEWMKMKARRVYEKVDDRVIKQVKHKMKGQVKDKKVE